MIKILCFCGNRFEQSIATEQGHEGFCSVECSKWREREKKFSTVKERKRKAFAKKEKRLAAQITRWERKQKKIAKKRSKQAARDTWRIKSDKFFRSIEWKRLRFDVLRKYGYCCMACGARPPRVVLHVDHIKPRIKYPDLALDINNLQVLCAGCNHGKGARIEDDLRPNISTNAIITGLH